jgi:hypothetical protein
MITKNLAKNPGTTLLSSTIFPKEVEIAFSEITTMSPFLRKDWTLSTIIFKKSSLGLQNFVFTALTFKWV